MKKISKISVLLIAFLSICNNALARDEESIFDGIFDSNIIFGAVIAALVTVLFMKYKTHKKK